MKKSRRRAVYSELKGYCPMSSDHDFMEVTEWSNGEGHDIHIDRKNSVEKFSLTHGEWDLMQVLMNWRG